MQKSWKMTHNQIKVGRLYKRLECILKLFRAVTKRPEGDATERQYGSIWEAVPAVELLIKPLNETTHI
jgi:hypothetical protein